MGLKEKLHDLKLHYQGTAFAPVFNAFHTFLYVPNETTHSGSHVRDATDLKRTMALVCMSLVPAILFGVYNIGFQHYNPLTDGDTDFMQNVLYGLCKFLPLLAVSYGVGLLVEFIFAAIKGHEVEEGFLVSGLLIPLIVPVDIPLWMLAIAIVFGVVIGKEVFGGTGMNILNPALTVRAFLFFAYPKFMSGDKVWVGDATTMDALSGETILGSLAAIQEGVTSKVQIDNVYQTFGDASTMFAGFIPGSIGETSTLAILIGAAILIYSGIASWRIMLSSFIGASLMGLIFNAIGGNALLDFPWYEHLLIGGFAFGTVFMATDPVSGTQTLKGKWIYGFLIGVISIMVRIFNPAFPEGVMMAILLMNVFAPLIDHYVIKGNINKRLNRLKNA